MWKNGLQGRIKFQGTTLHKSTSKYYQYSQNRHDTETKERSLSLWQNKMLRRVSETMKDKIMEE
jgi:hypothetical protein